jgi:N-methylhydantoinase A
MLTSNLRHDLVQFASIRLDEPESAARRLSEITATLIERGQGLLAEQGVAPERRRFEVSCDMQFEGQFNVLETRVPALDAGKLDAGDIGALRRVFEENHDRVYGYVLEGAPIEVQSVRLAAIGLTTEPVFRAIEAGGTDASRALKGARTAWKSRDAAIEWPIYEGARLRSGNEIVGPAIVEQPTTTLKIAPGWRAKVDAIGNVLMWRGGNLVQVLERQRAAGARVQEVTA